MEAEWDRAREPAARRAWEELLRPMAADLEAAAGELSRQVGDYVREQLPDLVADPEGLEENRASTEASIRAFASMIERGADPRSIELPAATLAYAQAGVRRGIAFATLQRSYRLGHEIAWEMIFSQLRERATDVEQLTIAASLCSTWLFAYVDTALTLGQEVYEAERDRWVRSAAASQAETIGAILSGRERDSEQASSRLRYRLDRHHVGVFAWIDAAPADVNPLAALETAISQLAASTAAESSMIQPQGLLAAAAWLTRSTPFDDHELDAARFDTNAASDVRIALGEPGAGLGGFRQSHDEAAHARRVATLAKRPPGTVTRYRDVALAAMSAIDPEQARVFVERALGELAGEDDVSRRVAATVKTYLEENASRSRAARRLGIHENTISYRVRQAEEILGHSLEDNTLQLRVALELLPVVRGAADSR